MIRISLCALALCASAFQTWADEAEPHHLDWLTGCWQSTDGATREVWSTSEDGYLFGYSVVRQDAQVVFFEQMRIDPAPLPIFQAYPAGQGPSAFPAADWKDLSVVFENAEHDFPQRIHYWREGNALKAKISKIDGSSAAAFDFVPCVSE